MSEYAFNIEFVKEVEKHPELYNFHLPEYTRKDLVEKAWSEVGKKMNMPGVECRERWKNLRSVFVRNLKLFPSGTKKRKPYYLMDAMQFALPFVKTATSVGNFPSTPGQAQSSKDEEDIDDADESSEESQQFRFSGISPLPPTLPKEPPPAEALFHLNEPYLSKPLSASQHSQTQNDQPVPSIPLQKKSGHKRNREDSNVEVDTSFVKYVIAKKSKHSTPKDQRREALRCFLLGLLPELEAMTEDQVKQFRRKIFLLIDDITGLKTP
ncbi:transcription factor Adf-1-like [Anabrus simplex]|uniref:transcription factor Adf-1-like n=1 Tax=Anabrus simplex TaxID=316456 RepID=UPI0035A322EF